LDPSNPLKFEQLHRDEVQDENQVEIQLEKSEENIQLEKQEQKKKKEGEFSSKFRSIFSERRRSGRIVLW
jgi:hypothetical protein